MDRKEYMRQYQKEYQRKRYKENKEYFYDKSRKSLEEKIEWFNKEVMPGLKCETCGEHRVGCLDFHHKDPNEKEAAVSTMVRRKCSKEKILEEIAKCQVLCANCHRLLHWKERNQ